jgi:SAM-dependent methyltransferase
VPGLASFLEHLRASCDDGSFVRLSLTSPTERAAPIERVLVRLVTLRGERHLSFTLRERQRDTTVNLTLAEGVDDVARRLRTDFRGALLATTAADWQLQSAPGGAAKLIRHRASTGEAPSRAHDTAKATLLDERARPWLQGLGVLDAQGRPRRNLADKLSQIERYAEILFHLARDCGWHEAAAGSWPLCVVDVGCGKGHLTFAAWHLVKHVLQREPRVVGVEARAELVAGANALAREIAGDGLQFVCGDISGAPLPAVDALVALHACNTATDHAIRRGVQAGARLIVVAPCCHQEVRPQLASPEPLAEALRHGLLAERMAEWATDALRTLVLEWAGYRTKVIEFVGSEHTAKNVMLAAVRAPTPPGEAQRAAARAAIDRLRAFFGIERSALDGLLAAPGA